MHAATVPARSTPLSRKALPRCKLQRCRRQWHAATPLPDQHCCCEKPTYYGASTPTCMQQQSCQVNPSVLLACDNTSPLQRQRHHFHAATVLPDQHRRCGSPSQYQRHHITCMQQQSSQIHTSVETSASCASSSSPARSTPTWQQALANPIKCIDSPAKSNTSVEGNPLAMSAPLHTCSNSPVRSIPLFEHVLATLPP